MLKPKELKYCKDCKDEFKPFNTLQTRCLKCSITHGRKIQKKTARRERKEYYENDRSALLKKCQTACNKYIRTRDKHLGCCSCDKGPLWSGQWHASHYRPSGNNSALRFNELNINKSCSECNNFKSGNLLPYRIALIEKIGPDAVDYLENHNDPYKWTIDDLKDITRYYRDKVKVLMV